MQFGNTSFVAEKDGELSIGFHLSRGFSIEPGDSVVDGVPGLIETIF